MGAFVVKDDKSKSNKRWSERTVDKRETVEGIHRLGDKAVLEHWRLFGLIL